MSSHAERRRPRRRGLRAFLQTPLIVAALVLAGLWVHSLLQGAFVNRSMVVRTPDGEEAAVIQRAVCSMDGRIWYAFAQSLVVPNVEQLPRRTRWKGGRYAEENPYRRMSAPAWLAPVVDWSARTTSKSRIMFITVSYWPLIVTTAACAWLAGRSSRLRRRRARSGLCEGCGYDIRATPQRCPECGLGSGIGIPACDVRNDHTDKNVCASATSPAPPSLGSAL